jgi:hypothetical protein
VIHLPHMAAAKETTLKEVGEMLTHVVEHMATKEYVSPVWMAKIYAGLEDKDKAFDGWKRLMGTSNNDDFFVGSIAGAAGR